MKRFITGRQVSAVILTLIAIAGLCCILANSEDYTVFCFTKIIGIALVYLAVRIWRGPGWARAWR